jgi:hypothetical protein
MEMIHQHIYKCEAYLFILQLLEIMPSGLFRIHIISNINPSDIFRPY